MINKFQDEYYFLSNFYPCQMEYEGISYQNSEAAFQAQKCANEADRRQFSDLNASEAKKLGRKVSLRPDWESVKVNVMRSVVKEKFLGSPDLARNLIATSGEYLEEGNTWGDRVWGTVDGKGANLLGQILMELREELATEIKEPNEITYAAMEEGEQMLKDPDARRFSSVDELVMDIRPKTTSSPTVDEMISYVKATMALSGLALSEKDVKLLRSVASGERSADDVRQEIYREIAEWHASRKGDEDGDAEGV